MKKTIISLTLFFIAALSSVWAEPVPKPFLELKLNGDLKNTGSGEFTVSKLRPDNLSWSKGRSSGKSFYFNNDLRNPGARGCFSALVIPGGSKKCDTAEPFTVAMWIMPDPAVVSRSCILFTGFSGDFGSGIKLLLNGRNVVVVEHGQGTRKSLKAVRGTKMEIKPGVWSHIAVTYDKKVCRIYINGILCKEEKAKLVTGSSSEITIGAYRKGYAYGYRGSMADLRIYKQALTELQVMMIARSE